MGNRSFWTTREGVLLIVMAVAVVIGLIWGARELVKSTPSSLPTLPKPQLKANTRQPEQPTTPPADPSITP